MINDLCWFHGYEPIPDDCHIVCLECSHAWTREALEEADAEKRGYRINADDISFCPLCIHDF